MRHALFCITFCALFAHAASAGAHAEEPNSQRIFPVEDGWVLRANFGIVASDQPDRLFCEEAYLGGDGWQLVVLGPTEWVTFGESTVQRTEDGCTYDEVATLERKVSDAAGHPAGAVAFLRNGEGDAGLWLSTDRGRTFERVAAIDTETYQLTGVRFMDGETLIVSGYIREEAGAATVWSIDVTDLSITELTPPADITFPYVLDARGDHILLLGRRDAQTVFWGTADEMEIAAEEVETWPSGAALSEDGTEAWISGPVQGRGVLHGTLDGEEAMWETLAAERTASCVARFQESVYICTINRFDEFDLMRVTDDGMVEGLLDFREFSGVREDCPAGSDVDEVCPLVWPELAPYFGIDVPDAGMSAGDAGVDAGEPDASTADTSGEDVAQMDEAPPTMEDPGGCCSTIHDRPKQARFPLWLGMLVASAAAVGRRLSSSSPNGETTS